MKNQKKVRTRIAPSPTGYPHIGTIFQALINFAYAKKYNGQFIVRIEDTDQSRLVEDAEKALFDALAWFELEPDESPQHGGDTGPYRQSDRLDIYQDHAQQLIKNGHAYYCFCSAKRLEKVRKRQQKQGIPPMYDQHCRGLDLNEAKTRAQKESHVIRLKVPGRETITFQDAIRGEISFESEQVDDQVLIKSDGFPTYHLAVVVDDHLMQISHLVRGEEWISSTPKHILLYRYFGWDMPTIIHTPILRNPDRSKLSKRHGHAAATWYIEKGYLKEAVRNFLATRVWNHPQEQEIFTLEEFSKHFEFKDMHIQGPIVDLDKLNWYNGQWIRQLSEKALIERLKPHQPEKLTDKMLKNILPHIKDRLVTLSDIDNLTTYLHTAPEPDTKLLLKQSKLSESKTAAYLKDVKEIIQNIDWSVAALEKSLRVLQKNSGLKPRPAFMTIRVAVTGRTATPPLFDVIHLLGRDEITTRLKSAIESL